MEGDLMPGKLYRFTVSVTKQANDEIRASAGRSGIRIGQFCSLALVMGARQLSRQYEPERYITADVIKSLVESGLVDLGELEKSLDE